MLFSVDESGSTQQVQLLIKHHKIILIMITDAQIVASELGRWLLHIPMYCWVTNIGSI